MDLSTDPVDALASVVPGPSESEFSPPELGDNSKPSRKIRSACTRCHSQKLRCVRQAGQVNCDRCLRLKSRCRFDARAPRSSLKAKEQVANGSQKSSSLPTTSPKSANTFPDIMTPAVQNNDWSLPIDTDMSYPEGINETLDVSWVDAGSGSRDANIPDFGLPSNLDLAFINQEMVNNMPILSSSSNFDPYPRIVGLNPKSEWDSSPTAATRRLANLSIALHECTGKFPFMSSEGTVSMSKSGVEIAGMRKTALFAIDELFRLTSDFINILTCFPPSSVTLSSIDPRQFESQSSTDLAVSLPHMVQQMSTSNMNSSVKHQTPDEATVCMIMACHSRLMETYQSVFGMMTTCVDLFHKPLTLRDCTIILPQLQVGTFSSPSILVDVDTALPPPKSSAYMFMVIMLAGQLWEQLSDAMKSRFDVRSGSGSPASLADSVWQTMMERTEKLERTIEDTRLLLQRSFV